MNGDGTVAGADLSVLLAQFETACGAEGFGGGVPDILITLGFESIENYVEYVDSLSPSELQAHLAQILELLD